MNKTNAIEVNKKIREMIKEKLNITADADEITDEFSFGVANGFDSTSLLEFILELEDTFDIVIPDDAEYFKVSLDYIVCGCENNRYADIFCGLEEKEILFLRKMAESVKENMGYLKG